MDRPPQKSNPSKVATLFSQFTLAHASKLLGILSLRPIAFGRLQAPPHYRIALSQELIDPLRCARGEGLAGVRVFLSLEIKPSNEPD